MNDLDRVEQRIDGLHCGFALYSLLYAGLGSMASRTEDVQQATGPMIMIGLGGYFAAFVALNTPDAAWVKLLSVIPFFSPYMLPMRMLLSSVAPWRIGRSGPR